MRAWSIQRAACCSVIGSRSSSAAVESSLASSEANRCTASAAELARTAGGNTMLTAMPTAAPIRVSLIRSVAAASAPPTASTSMALIGTSSMCGPSRSSWPTRMEIAISAPRLHQVSPTIAEKPTASSTPAVTLAIRCTPLVTMSLSVTSTTSSAVSGARIGTVSGNST